MGKNALSRALQALIKHSQALLSVPFVPQARFYVKKEFEYALTWITKEIRSILSASARD